MADGALQRFFFPVKIKSARESHFCPFLRFFHGRDFFFTHTFSRTVEVFHGHFWRFFHGHDFCFHGCKIEVLFQF